MQIYYIKLRKICKKFVKLKTFFLSWEIGKNLEYADANSDAENRYKINVVILLMLIEPTNRFMT